MLHMAFNDQAQSEPAGKAHFALPDSLAGFRAYQIYQI